VKKRCKQILRSAVLWLLVVCSLQVNLVAPPVKAVTQAEIDALKGDANSIAAEKKDLQAKINAIKSDKANAIRKKNLLDQESDLIRDEIKNVSEQIAAYEALIAQTKAELLDAEKREEAQHDLFCRCLREMEEGGTVSYWSVLFNAASFEDLLSRLDAASEVLDYRHGVIENLRKLQQETAAKKVELETQLSEQEATKTALESKKLELDAQVKSAASMIAEIQEDQVAAEELLDEVLAEGNRIQKEIKRLEEELAASLGPATAGGYIWPVKTSKRITSPFGNRWHPVYHKWKFHNGVDIGGVGYNSSVYATKAGVVIISQKSSSYGNYVVISHGTGNTTLYAHMSSRSVSVGDKVSQGQVIGITGSTGVSTGPHLHYEITEGGSRVDPLKYLPGYVKGWS